MGKRVDELQPMRWRMEKSFQVQVASAKAARPVEFTLGAKSGQWLREQLGTARQLPKSGGLQIWEQVWSRPKARGVVFLTTVGVAEDFAQALLNRPMRSAEVRRGNFAIRALEDAAYQGRRRGLP